ncbi:MAG: glucose-1-phosphate adenylyltransferase [Alphaproteobacteria bacterium]|nr:glucose-1-phosphate adenylyltransferase [Alphaproteobacteria bacterium]
MPFSSNSIHPASRDITRLVNSTMALVLAGGRGSRLKSLTDWRAKPAVPFAGKFRIIDFTLSNCINSGIRKVGVLTQYKAHSLIQHVQRGWSFLRAEINEFIEIMPAQQRMSEENWYKGTADAVYQNLDILRSYAPEYLIILAGDHIYKMDYSKMVLEHVMRGADCTVGCFEMPLEGASAFGIMQIDEHKNVVSFKEKPENPEPMPGKPDRCLVSMGIYVFNTRFLLDLLESDSENPESAHDFGKNIIPDLIGKAKVVAHFFRDSCVIDAVREPYWRDVGTLDAYWDANIDLTTVTPALNLYDTSWPIWTYQAQLPSAKFVFDSEDRRGMAVDALVSGGCIISGATVRRSLLFSNVRVNSYANIEDAVILPDCDIGRNSVLKKVILDRGCLIPPGLVVGEDPELDAERFLRTEGGVTLVTRDMLKELEL